MCGRLAAVMLMLVGFWFPIVASAAGNWAVQIQRHKQVFKSLENLDPLKDVELPVPPGMPYKCVLHKETIKEIAGAYIHQRELICMDVIRKNGALSVISCIKGNVSSNSLAMIPPVNGKSKEVLQIVTICSHDGGG